jgi:hypothetical protein
VLHCIDCYKPATGDRGHGNLHIGLQNVVVDKVDRLLRCCVSGLGLSIKQLYDLLLHFI